jgi:sacsin
MNDGLDASGMRGFGQKVDLCQRIRDVCTNYPEGALLKEMVQNADDAGARTCGALRAGRLLGRSTLLSPALAGFQGPALLTYNDRTFTDRDFESIQHLGGSRKTDADMRSKTGRFGVGFNSSYHLTDLPCFVSRRYLVMLDPHCTHVPDATSAEPGKLIDVLSPGLAQRLADQLAPFRVFGVDMEREVDATIFRLPLRTKSQAACSRISRRAAELGAAEGLLAEFAASLPECCLFLTHIHTMEVSVWREGAAQPTVLRTLTVADARTGAPPDRRRLHSLVGSAMVDLSAVPQVEAAMALRMHSHGPAGLAGGAEPGDASGAEPGDASGAEHGYTVVQKMGGGEALRMSTDPAVASHGLQPVPWGGVSACTRAGDGGATLAVHGRPYVLLPLPSSTGLPVHVNGFFEISSNRRDIWYGDDMIGAGKLRSDWNRALLHDVVAPSYAELLLQSRELQGRPSRYFELWPSSRPAEPWGGLVDTLYGLLLDQPVLYSEGTAGWVSPRKAVFASSDAAGAAAGEGAAVHAALVRGGMPLVRAPAAVVELLWAAARAAGVVLRTADAATVRTWLLQHDGWSSGLSVEEGTGLLRHCLQDVEGGGASAEALRGLRLLPLLSGGWGTFEPPAAEVEASALLGQMVELRDFSSRPELNGRRGLALEYSVASNQCAEITVHIAAPRMTAGALLVGTRSPLTARSKASRCSPQSYGRCPVKWAQLARRLLQSCWSARRSVRCCGTGPAWW